MSVPQLTAPLHGRIVVRVPYQAGIRRQLTQATAAEPHWEPSARVWTLPRRALAPAADAVARIFGTARVAEEIPAPRGGTPDWIHYDLVAQQHPTA